MGREGTERKGARDGVLEFYSKIAGVSHDNEDGTRRQFFVSRLRVGEPLSLVHVPNDYSNHAVAVYNSDGQQLGFLPDETAKGVAVGLDAGKTLWAEVVKKTGGTPSRPTIGCNIVVCYDEKSLADPGMATARRKVRREAEAGMSDQRRYTIILVVVAVIVVAVIIAIFMEK